MIYGIGTDILKMKNIASTVSDPDDPFVRQAFTEKELELILSKPDPTHSYATRFSGKEAVFKTLDIDGDVVRLNEIEILEDEVGKPTVTLLGKAAEIAEEKGITKIHISLSYEIDYAIAYAIAEI